MRRAGCSCLESVWFDFLLIHQQHRRSQGLISAHYRCFAYMAGKEPRSDSSHCCSLLSLCYPTRQILADRSVFQGLCRTLAQPQQVPGALCQLGEEPSISQRAEEETQSQPTLCTSPSGERERLRPPAALQETFPPSVPGGTAKPPCRGNPRG